MLEMPLNLLIRYFFNSYSLPYSVSEEETVESKENAWANWSEKNYEY